MASREYSVDAVKKACEDRLLEIQKWFDLESELYILNEMKSHLWGLIKGRTREAAIQSLNSTAFNDYYGLKLVKQDLEYEVKKILMLCDTKTGNNIVRLTGKDIIQLRKYL